MIKKQSFLKGSVFLMLSMIIVKALGALFKIPLTNLLGATGMGYFSAAYNIYALIYALGVTGLSSAMAKKTAQYKAENRHREVKTLFRLSLLLFSAVGIVGSAITALSGSLLTGFIGNDSVRLSILAVSPALFFCAVMAAFRGYYEGLSDMRPTAVTQVIEVVFKLVFGLLFAYLGITVMSKSGAGSAEIAAYGACGAMLGVTISTMLGAAYMAFKYTLDSKQHFKGLKSCEKQGTTNKKQILCELAVIALPISLAAIMAQLSAFIDTVTIQNSLITADKDGIIAVAYSGYISSGETAPEYLFGIFSSCVTLFNVIPAFCISFAKSGLPAIASAAASDKTALMQKANEIIKITSITASPLAIGMLFMAKPVLTLAYPKHIGIIEIGAPLLSILAVGGLCLALVGTMTAILQGAGRASLPVYAFVPGLAVKVLLNMILVSNSGINIYGAAVSTLICDIVILLMFMFFLKKKAKIKLDLLDSMLKPIFFAIICAVTARGAHILLTKLLEHSIITIISVIVGAAVYLLLLIFTDTVKIKALIKK